MVRKDAIDQHSSVYERGGICPVLQVHLLAATRRIFGENPWILQQDGDGTHTARSTLSWLESNNVTALSPWPAHSPDLNPIEKAWSKLKQILRSTKARTKEALEKAITEAIRLITPNNAKAWFNHCISGLQ